MPSMKLTKAHIVSLSTFAYSWSFNSEDKKSDIEIVKLIFDENYQFACMADKNKCLPLHYAAQYSQMIQYILLQLKS